MQNRWLRYGLIALAGLLALGIVFGAGFFAGRWSNRERIGAILGRGFLFGGAHGAMGAIQEIHGQTLIVKLRDGTTQTVLTDPNTRIERNLKKVTLGDLKSGDRVLVVGTPDAQGQIKAILIRVTDIRSATPTPSRLSIRNSETGFLGETWSIPTGKGYRRQQ